MIYKLASRDNIESECLEQWPAILDTQFMKFNNCIENITFSSEDEILNWLESKCRTRATIGHNTNIQTFRNGDPNKIYSVYQSVIVSNNSIIMPNDLSNTSNNNLNKYSKSELNKYSKEGMNNDINKTSDIFLYSLRYKKSNEAYMTFTNEKGIKIKSSFKKTTINYPPEEKVDYSHDIIRIIKKKYYEGIYPHDATAEDQKDIEYMQYAKDIHMMDPDKSAKNKDFSVVFVDNTCGSKWLDYFIVKLLQVEKYLDFFAKGGNLYVNINKENNHAATLEYIFELLIDNKKNTIGDNELQTNIKNLIIDPILCDEEIYQVRYMKTLLSWHKNYSYVMRKHNLMPSKQFADFILDFNLSDFYKQKQSRENLLVLIRNIMDIYDIHNVDIDTEIMKRTKKTKKDNSIEKNDRVVKYNKVVKSFKYYES
jgi:hypothetical protein